MKQFIALMAVLWACTFTSPFAHSQSKLNEGAMLIVEASSVVLFSEDALDKGTENPMGNLAAIAGYRMSPYFAAGLGFGFDLESKSDSKSVSGSGIYNEDITSTVSTPIFIHLRSELMPDAKVCPFVSADLGYRATLTRTTDEQKIVFNENKEKLQDMQYSRFYNTGAFAELTLGASLAMNSHRLEFGLSYVNYTRRHSTLNFRNGEQVYNGTNTNKNGLSFKVGISF